MSINSNPKDRFAIVGGAGFIGSNFVKYLLKNGHKVTVIDNFTSGTIEHLKEVEQDPQLKIHNFDVSDTQKLVSSFKNIHTVVHLASNPDISKATSFPRIDFDQGTKLTESVVEAARLADVATIFYASGSGVYGDVGNQILDENSKLQPISTYGASKLAGEALIASYSYMFGIKGLCFRFANVVGPMQTHGIGYDFIRKLKRDNSKLDVLGNGNQSKSYIYVDDVINALMTAYKNQILLNDVYNISTDDSLNVKDIAKMAIKVMGLEKEHVPINYGNSIRGWKADVPIVRLSSEKIRAFGWSPILNSTQAMKLALDEMKHEQV